jgi:hypothetical protein
MQDQAPQAPPQPASTPSAPATIAGVQVITGAPRAVYQAAREKREVLGDQMSRLLNRRDNIAERLQRPNLSASETAALEQHMREITTRIVDMEKQLHASDAEVSTAAGVPGAVAPPPRSDPRWLDEDSVGIAVGFAGIALVVLAIGHARRAWKGAATTIAQLPASFEQRFNRMEDSIDAIAIEVERVSEGQRYLSRVYGDQNARAVGAGAAEPVEVRAASAEPVRRG